MSISALKEQLRQRDARIKELEKEIRELKKLLVEKAQSKESKPPPEASNFSVSQHERKGRKKRRRKNSTGRKPKDAKRDLATDSIDLYWQGASRKKCVLRREQLVWRLIDGKAEYVHYRIFDEPDSTDLPPVDGVRNGKSEYGLEILITLTYLVYWTGMSIDKACGILAFFTGLSLSKSQADSLLSQLATDWQIEYDAIAELVASAAILYIDETGWKVGKRSCYTWIFSTLSTVLYKCGVGRGKVVLTEILGEQFDGIGVTDDYSAYQSQFKEHQLCWAHFLRKAIALSLRNPENDQYKRFLKSLFAIYRDAVRFRHDRRLSAGRRAKVNKLQTRIRMICRRYGEILDEAAPADEAKFVLLQNELVGNTEKLFVFVLHPEIVGSKRDNPSSEKNSLRCQQQLLHPNRPRKVLAILQRSIATLPVRFSNGEGCPLEKWMIAFNLSSKKTSLQRGRS